MSKSFLLIINELRKILKIIHKMLGYIDIPPYLYGIRDEDKPLPQLKT